MSDNKLGKARESWFEVGRKSEQKAILRMLNRLFKSERGVGHRALLRTIMEAIRGRNER